ncbi:MAG: hypothetical protein QG661_3138, partial [Actinomycetota bacterium]|nr:hypothetical protein [Actinomycetota bacterium]
VAVLVVGLSFSAAFPATDAVVAACEELVR